MASSSAPTSTFEDFLVAQAEAKRNALREMNADPSNWDWPISDGWTRSHSWDTFIKQCRSFDLEQLTTPGGTITLDVPVEHDTLDPTRGNLYIREVYLEVHEQLWERATTKRLGGMVLTGQPGTGKTMFLWYLLVCMLREKQVVLLYMASCDTVLFYHDQVFVAPASVSNLSLPHYHADKLDFSQVCIWSLFDVPVEDSVPKLVWKGICYPVTAPSPNRDRMKYFIKYRTPYIGGFPLWTLQELRDAFPLHLSYAALIKLLEVYIDHWSDALPKGPWGNIIEALKAEYGNEKPASVEEAWQTLMDIVIFHLGYAPRDVFKGMSELGQLKTVHLAALRVSYAEILDIVQTFEVSSQLPNDNKIVCIIPHRRPTDDVVLWDIDFKSLWVAKEVSRRLMEAQESEARRLIWILRGIPEAGALLGHMFEPFVHRLLTNERTGNPWPLLKMQSNDVKHAPTFAVDPSVAAASGTQGFPGLRRKVVRFDSRIPSSLAHGIYYIPQKKTSPFVDAFTVEIDNTTCSAILWLLQVTNSEHHDGSERGYTWIRELITALQDELESRRREPPKKKHKDSGAVRHKWEQNVNENENENEHKAKNPQVSVRYVLVRPKGEGSASWKMPEGWDVQTPQVDHRGPAYLLQVPMVAHASGSEVMLGSPRGSSTRVCEHCKHRMADFIILRTAMDGCLRATPPCCTASVPGARGHVTANRLSSGETHPVSGHDWTLTCEPAIALTGLWELSLPASSRSGAPVPLGDSDTLHSIHFFSFAGSSPHCPSWEYVVSEQAKSLADIYGSKWPPLPPSSTAFPSISTQLTRSPSSSL
ncbi:hypothetical protein L226DRAFT_567011 [Lentinus tigrinus ALCF2SS1-7]|uniref:Uncharacterized protein n=1 Tax=Lentinus tigrinus ALCF2SS1-6 TaxID=1328759 RepID=A0A5C2SRV0_9APHY|nr:hypothetical protein L227DRAFT_606674 [Lentinus tigrinus ALCF2SS1-6]RPD80543.1 hypothetical protein L226DRAFT_567011 [Lentinus tigrinus ALCF2SS1-7]